ncbi:EcsC family protein [Aeromicrobium wangtongii]|uniref:EcsC family protein n=1 Tax=Aeromicrobium wangtongii TaxID=2969247 RepID=UPI002017249C|nr:EcsC family protein [Aeromicrobium wangtongii]MCL3817199.1 EcsC family protein [Aeromicrobium wangtongii]
MGVRRSAAMIAGSKLAPTVGSGYVRIVLDRAIDGIGPLRSAAASADTKLVDAGGDVEKAFGGLLRMHTSLAGVQGFVTNIGGLATAALAVPANVAGVTIVQCHLVAGVAHLRGYDLEDPRVRNAILACMLGEDAVAALVKSHRLPSSPMALATSPVHDPVLDTTLSKEVTAELVGRTAGRRAVTLIGRRVPFLGGAVGGSSDAWATWQIGTYAGHELKDRRRH